MNPYRDPHEIHVVLEKGWLTARVGEDGVYLAANHHPFPGVNSSVGPFRPDVARTFARELQRGAKAVTIDARAGDVRVTRPVPGSRIRWTVRVQFVSATGRRSMIRGGRRCLAGFGATLEAMIGRQAVERVMSA